MALNKHAEAESEIFYPAARDAVKQSDDIIVDEALVEHASAKKLIAQIFAMYAREASTACRSNRKKLSNWARYSVRSAGESFVVLVFTALVAF